MQRLMASFTDSGVWRVHVHGQLPYIDLFDGCEMQALSRVGRCQTFEAAADGYGRGEGIAVLLLGAKSREGSDTSSSMAILRGSAVNQDGRCVCADHAAVLSGILVKSICKSMNAELASTRKLMLMNCRQNVLASFACSRPHGFCKAGLHRQSHSLLRLVQVMPRSKHCLLDFKFYPHRRLL